jgi:hypothetical protein
MKKTIFIILIMSFAISGLKVIKADMDNNLVQSASSRIELINQI